MEQHNVLGAPDFETFVTFNKDASERSSPKTQSSELVEIPFRLLPTLVCVLDDDLHIIGVWDT
jgi:hypothetical protein